VLGDQVTIRRRPETATVALPAILHPVLRRVLARRDLHDAGDLDLALERLPDPDDLYGCPAAAARLVTALEQGTRILVVGDYDADGATSSALALRALRRFGASAVDFLVPNRFTSGYGLTPEVVALAAARTPGLLVTASAAWPGSRRPTLPASTSSSPTTTCRVTTCRRPAPSSTRSAVRPTTPAASWPGSASSST
jgi:hypothetical protein